MKPSQLIFLLILIMLIYSPFAVADGSHANTTIDTPSHDIVLTATVNGPTDNIRINPKGMWAGNSTKFFQGAFIGFLGHESGHVITNYIIDTDPYLKSVHYGPIPFFTIEPGHPLSDREHYLTASAGFNATNIINEWLLTKHPNLKDEDEPFLKGLASFNFWINAGYIATALAGTGPDERDTKGMADSLGWNERTVGLMILIPTALDTYRYKHPDAKWAKTASRVSKLVMIGLVFTID